MMGDVAGECLSCCLLDSFFLVCITLLLITKKYCVEKVRMDDGLTLPIL